MMLIFVVSDGDFGAHDAEPAAPHADFGASDSNSIVSVAEFAASDADNPI